MDNATFSDLACGLNLIAAVTGNENIFYFLCCCLLFDLFYLFGFFWGKFSCYLIFFNAIYFNSREKIVLGGSYGGQSRAIDAS